MKRKELKKIVLLLTVAAVIGSVPTYSYAGAADENSVKSVKYTLGDIAKENGYRVDKYEGVNGQQLVNADRVINLKTTKVNDGYKKSISVYNLKTKENKEYGSINISLLQGISPNGRYVHFAEPRNVPTVGSKEWQDAVDSGELFYMKQDILDLETGKVITDFDKTPHNYESQYKWINDDYIFANHYSSWKIMNKNGEVIKEGKYNYSGYAYEFAHLVDVSELKVENNEVSGSFYYTKEFMGSDKNLGSEIFSMDVNTEEEKSIRKCEHSNDVFKKKDTIAADFFNNNGGPVGYYYVNRTFGFNILDKSGNRKRSYELPWGKDYLNLSLSTDGQKCAFVEIDSYMNKNADEENAVLKVLDIKTGEVREIAKMKDLKNPDKESEVYNRVYDTPLVYTTRIFRISNLLWSNDGKTLMFNYSYTSKETGENCNDTYTVTFND